MRPQPTRHRSAATAAVLVAVWATVAPVEAQEGTRREGPPPAGLRWQDPWWNGKTIKEVRGRGFATHSFESLRATRLTLREGMVATPELLDQNLRALHRTGLFDPRTLKIEPLPDPSDPQGVILEVQVRELEVVAEVVLRGAQAISESELREGLRISRPAETLMPYRMAKDRLDLESRYRSQGYHFVQISPETESLGDGRVRLIWNVVEGPKVSVDDIEFHGFVALDEDVLKTAMGTRESRLFSSTTFVERRLELDVDRLKLLLAQHGYLDAPRGDTVFVRDLDFPPDRSKVDIHIQIVETPLYRVGEVVIEGHQVLSKEKIEARIRLRPGDPCNELTAMEDIKEISNLYAERSYILAKVEYRWEAMEEPHTMRLRVRITEGQPAIVGIIEFEGHRRTRDDVLRRELRSFAPGEPFDGTELERGIQRLYDTGWFEAGSITYESKPGRIPGTQDVHIKVQERNTGTLRLLGGYSSAFGLVGVVDFTQQNFDATRLPRSLDEFLRGEAFVGGGQYLNLRFMPGQRRDLYSVTFREPYIFGLDYGGGFTVHRTLLNRESWDELSWGGGFFLDRRWGDLRVAMNFSATSIEISNVEPDAPSTVLQLEGSSLTVKLGPSLTYDRRDSRQLATSGYLVQSETWISSRTLGSDFNFWKVQLEGEYLIALYEPEERNRMRRHVLSLRGTLGLAGPFGGDDSVPFFDRFFAGGRGSIRGFAFRGMGPHEGDDPTGGEMLVLGTVEYSLPLYEDFLRLAFFVDVGNLAPKVRELGQDKWRTVAGLGLRALIPFLSQAPVALDFGVAITKEDFDDEQLVTFDVGKLFF